MDNYFNFTGLRGTLRHNEPMSKHTSWRVGGPAQWFYEPADVIDLAQLLPQLPDNMPVFWLGLGSNLLVRDGGIRGLVILTAGLLNEIKQLNDNTLYVEAGVSSAKVARFAARAGLTGAEFLAGIPGTFGGALAMNAGAWGGETWSLVQRVETLNRQGQSHRRLLTDYEISYRSVKGQENEWFIAATLQLSDNPKAEGSAKIQALLKQRNETQPTGLPTCGSVFRNPPGDYAARLIEQAGWKGRYVGGACVSEKHANFIINNNGAIAADIESLIKQIQADVAQKYQIDLIPEVHIVGEP
ncbi:MAG: UDP-N-acetylenolpyruvoylglucosamine reductase [Candidatus Parabeggiatoa sp. nov. 1]|nr:MAG: UDP-N-acetylenolpyruvoylglucosamine reductase [Gammaproteobacteria bacterium]